MLLGIAHSDVPVSSDGKLLVDNHMKWLQQRFEIESQQESEDCLMDTAGE